MVRFPDCSGVFAAVLLSLALAACQSSKAPVAEPVVTPPPVAEAPPKPEPAAPPQPQTPARVEPERRPLFDTGQFIGLGPKDLETRLGKPALRRREGFIKGSEAEVWQYVSGACVLHLYLYGPNTGSGPLKVDHVTVETRPGPWGENLNPQGFCARAFPLK